MDSATPLTRRGMEKLSRDILALLSLGGTSGERMTRIALLVQRATASDAVGIRLVDGPDYPYWFTSGFDDGFVRDEMFLCARDRSGMQIRKSDGDPELECLCGRVIGGANGSTRPVCTQNGSFWVNSTSDFLAGTTAKERPARFRGRCAREGYESVALIPLRHEGTTHGLLQLNDRRRNLFSDETIFFLEGVAAGIAALFSAKKEQQPLVERTADATRVLSEQTKILEQIAAELGEVSGGDGANPVRAEILTRLDTILNEIRLLDGILPICCQCKKIRDDRGDWHEPESYIRDRSAAEFTHAYCPGCYRALFSDLERR